MNDHHEDQVREALARQADSVQPHGTYADLRRRIAADEAARRRWVRPALLGAAAVLALLVGFTATMLVADDDDGERVGTTGRSTTTEVETTTTTEAPATTTTPTTEPPTSSTQPSGSSTTTSEPPTTTAPSTTTTTPPSTVPPSPAVTAGSPVTVTGIGPLVTPMSLTDASRLFGRTLTASYDLPPCGFAETGIAGLWLMVDGETVVRVDVTTESPGITTAAGIGEGSTEAEVRAAYPGVVTQPGTYSGNDMIVTNPASPDHSLLFQTDGQRVTDLRSGLSQWVAAPEGCA